MKIFLDEITLDIYDQASRNTSQNLFVSLCSCEDELEFCKILN